MPGFVNIGAYVDEGSMIDTWATVGSCAQIGKNVHLSGGVGIGGVLEPPQAAPVIVEDGAFIGSRCIVVEGVRVASEAVLGAGVVLTASTPIVDVRGQRTGRDARLRSGPGGRRFRERCRKRFPAGEYGTPCALIVGTRDESTDQKTSLNAGAARVRGGGVNPRVLEIPGSMIRQVAAKRRSTSIDLGMGEPSLLPNRKHFEAAMRYVVEHGVKYTPNAGDPRLRERDRGALPLSGNGATPRACALRSARKRRCTSRCMTLLDPARDELLVVEPAFPSYAKMAALERRRLPHGFDARRRRFCLRCGPHTGGGLRLRRARSSSVSPCNPTGRVLARDASRAAACAG